MGRLRNLLIVNERPGRIALAFAIGVCVGISPLLGLHTVLGLVIAAILRLNRVVTLTGVYVTNPWTIVPIYAFCTWIGTIILRVNVSITTIDWHNLKLRTVAHELEELFMPFLVGSSVVAVVAAFISYFLVKKALEQYRLKSYPANTGNDQ